MGIVYQGNEDEITKWWFESDGTMAMMKFIPNSEYYEDELRALLEFEATEKQIFTPPEGAFVAPYEYDPSIFPEGTEIIITPDSDEPVVVTDLTQTITLQDPGTYDLIVNPPYPHIGFFTRMEIT